MSVHAKWEKTVPGKKVYGCYSVFFTISIIIIIIIICLPNISFIFISHQYNGTFLLTY